MLLMVVGVRVQSCGWLTAGRDSTIGFAVAEDAGVVD